MSTSDYKLIHEAFIQNNNGTNALDTFITILPVYFTSCLLKHTIIAYGIVNYYFRISLEFSVLVIPVILITTIASNYRFHLLILLFVIFCYFCWNNLYSMREIWNLKPQHKKKWLCISYVRALISLITVHCILAVDFNVFPRYFAKTEKFGYSLMDTGVGLFVFSNALVPSKISKYSLFQSLEQNIKQCLILLILGYFRTVIINEIDYQQHVTEYGLHWNFFFTLAITKFLGTCILYIFKEEHALLVGIVLMCLHEILLQNGLSEWVFSDIARDNFISANREGIISSLGYLSLFLVSTFVGQLIREKYFCKSESKIIKSLLYTALCSWSITCLTNIFFQVSRCLANMGYCSFILSIGVTMLFLFYIYELSERNIEKYSKDKKNVDYNFSIILNAINNNGLLFFLVGNMVTGLVNILFQTIFLNTFISMIIIFLHMIFVTMGIVSWENRKFRNYV